MGQLVKLLYVMNSRVGGLGDYAHEQANALGNAGIEVRVVSSRKLRQARPGAYHVLPPTVASQSEGEYKSSWMRRFRKLGVILRQQQNRALAELIVRNDYRHVLFASYLEYGSPLWAWRLRRLSRKGVVFGSVVHDPVRDYVEGPVWWHRRSVAAAYSFLREAFVHDEITLDTIRPMPQLRTTVIPHGPYRFPEPSESRLQVRQRLELPEKALVMLSFGLIRDGKNLDLIIHAMNELSSIYLIVAGKELSSKQKTISYYQDLARSLKVDDRCRWIHGHVPEKEVGNLFIAADLILLTYNRGFRSASGVLNVGVHYRKPCVASSGGGNLRSVVERYKLGWFVEPDSIPALVSGIESAQRNEISTQWEAYEAENSWERNAQIVKARMFDKVQQRLTI